MRLQTFSELGYHWNYFFFHYLDWSDLMHARQGHNEVLNPGFAQLAAPLDRRLRRRATGSEIKGAYRRPFDFIKGPPRLLATFAERF